MESNQPKFSFRAYIDKNVNLFTVIGIFNALAIYSAGLDDIAVSNVMSFVFTMLSIAMLVPVIKDLPEDYEDTENTALNMQISLFKLGLIAAEFMLVFYVMKKFKGFLLGFVFLSTLYISFPLIIKIIGLPIISKYTEKFRKNLYQDLLGLLFIIIGLIVSAIVTFLAYCLINFILYDPSLLK